MLILSLGGVCVGAPPVTGLKAIAREGQVFLTWHEAETQRGTTFNVYSAHEQITTPAKAKRIAHHIEPHSARDWWEDPASFKKGAPPGEPIGFITISGSERCDPSDGLFVHTTGNQSRDRLFFAVTCTDPAGREDTTLVAGANSLIRGILPTPGEIQPIWQHHDPPPGQGSGKGMPLWLNLHAKGGVVTNSEYLVFGDATMGWREGLPFKFSVRISNEEVVVQPTDRAWINRPHAEASDSGTPAIWTFWYGYNSRIYDRAAMADGVPTNYTERRNLWILRWVSKRYETDPNRWYCSGSSMGGCGTISFGLRHPELFAACHAHVPIVSYTYLGRGSASRLEPSCWIGHISPDLKSDEGVPLLERMDGTRFVTETKADLPLLFLVNGRQDGSIPWENNPPFYRALNAARQGFAAYWDNGTHSTAGNDAPEDVKAWRQRFRRVRLDQSYPAFANTSSDRNCGNGAPDDGDLIGWMNRGMDWKDIEDAKDHYAITLLADYPGIVFPVRTDITLRRVQNFKTRPAEKFTAHIGDAVSRATVADDDGLITIREILIPSQEGTRVRVDRPY